ncbi:hypothetical protein ACF0H5_011627 [Mactra antiquata]
MRRIKRAFSGQKCNFKSKQDFNDASLSTCHGITLDIINETMNEFSEKRTRRNSHMNNGLCTSTLKGHCNHERTLSSKNTTFTALHDKENLGIISSDVGKIRRELRRLKRTFSDLKHDFKSKEEE